MSPTATSCRFRCALPAVHLFGLATMLAAPCAGATDGLVAFSSGPATLVAKEGGTTGLKKGLPVRPGDLLRTGPDGRAQVRLGDGTFVSLSAATDLRIDGVGQSAEEAPFTGFTLYRGGARFMAGTEEAHEGRRLRVVTAFATLQADSAEMVVALGKTLQVSVGVGRVSIRNAAGALEVGPGQRAFVADRDHPPLLIGTVVPVPVTPR